MNYQLIAVDPGGYGTKYMTHDKLGRFDSIMGEYRERRLEQSFGPDDMVVEYQGNKFFAGTLARYESEYAGSLLSDSKAHEEAKLRVLMAIHRVITSDHVKLITSQPIVKHIESEKRKIRDMLLGRHVITVNGEKKQFYVDEVNVGAEGGVAFWSHPIEGKDRILDIGSGTVNGATLDNRRYIDRESDTISLGMGTNLQNDPERFSRAISIHFLRKWNREDQVRVCGYEAETMLPFLHSYFPNAIVLKPKVRMSGQITFEHPVYANVVGLFEILRRLHG
jgi:plasmid segregation protein ParM